MANLYLPDFDQKTTDPVIKNFKKSGTANSLDDLEVNLV
jgi:hypothetical protein